MPKPKEKKKPKFWIQFHAYADMGSTIRVNFIVNPKYNVAGIVDAQHSKDSVRVVTLLLNRQKEKLGRRGYSLKQEWEQKPPKKKRVEA